MMIGYTDLIKSIIKRDVSKGANTKEFIDGLYETIRNDIVVTARMVGLAEVDQTTLESYFQTAKNEYLTIHPIDPGISHSLTRKGFKTWLTDEKQNSISWDYTDRYLQYLHKTGRSEKVVDETKRSSLEIVRKIANPKSGHEVYTKGLVVGAVQSGKTGNFNAVINRAIDCGYKLIIVLSGIMEDLRNQTQKRIESDVIGEGRDPDTNITSKKGVGEIVRFGPLFHAAVPQVKSITSSKSDFKKPLLDADFSLNDINLLVCKKNVSTLRNLIVWLSEYDERGQIPFLILDDEADNASLNNLGHKGRNYASRTNSQIRALLALFKIKTYLGYTATPFANVLQDRNDEPDISYVEKFKENGEIVEKELDRVPNIFPDDFIELLDPPSNYVGAKQIFETVNPIENQTDENEKIPLIAAPVDDYLHSFPNRVYENNDGKVVGVKNIRSQDEWNEEFGHGGYLDFSSYSEYRKETRAPRKEESFPSVLPDSLIEAINCFLLTLAIREIRKPKMINSKLFQPHNTMLIHVSRFTLWQNSTKHLVEEYVSEAIQRISNERPSDPDSIYYELERIWYKHFAHIVEKIHDYLPKDYEDPFMVSMVYDTVKQSLPHAVRNIEVKAINSLTGDQLHYPKNEEKKYIAIGGNRLSRGFTLEGLTINYFIRSTNYSDTLLQMGRWFGYRPGYLDCCKIFTTRESLDSFNSTTRCIEELESEFIKMQSQGKEPRSFEIRVRKHPGVLKITRPSILKNAEDVNWSYADQLQMTTQLKVDKVSITEIWNNFTQNTLPRFNNRIREDIITFETDVDGMIHLLSNQPNNFGEEDANYMTQFLRLCKEKGVMNNWTVGLKITGSSDNSMPDLDRLNPGLNLSEIRLARRSGPTRENDLRDFLEKGIFRASSKSANIISSNEDMSILLSQPQKDAAWESFYKVKAAELCRKDKSLSEEDAMRVVRTKHKTIPERYYRERLSENHGLMIIYLFDSRYAFNQLGKISNPNEYKVPLDKYLAERGIDTSIPLVGYAIEFPPVSQEVGGVYMRGQYDLDIDENVDEEFEDAFEELPDDETDL